MDIFLTASGTRGDVQPALALAQGLKNAGHTVRIAAGRNFAAWIESHGFTCVPMLDMEALMQSEDGIAWAQKGSDQMAQLRLMTKMVNDNADALSRPLLEHGRDCDLHISGFTSTQMVAVVAQKHNIPHIEAALQPYRATRSGAATLVPMRRGNSILNLLFGKLGQRFMWSVVREVVNTMRRREGMPILTAGSATRLTNRTPLVNGYSPQVVPHSPDWTPDSATTGYWFLDEESKWTPSAGLTRFLEQSPAPLAIGFGSMSSADPQAVFDLAYEALRISKQRAVFLSGWSGMKNLSPAENILILDKVPHSWLFERVAGVVHHGGAGTTAAGLRAGKPTVIVPHMADQPFWGRRVHDLGAGAKPIPRPKLTAENLAAAMAEITSNGDMQRRASELGAKIRAEDGIARGVEAIERFYKKRAAHDR